MELYSCYLKEHEAKPRLRAKPNRPTVRLYCLAAFLRWQPSTLVVDNCGPSVSSSSSCKAAACSAKETAGALAEELGRKAADVV